MGESGERHRVRGLKAPVRVKQTPRGRLSDAAVYRCDVGRANTAGKNARRRQVWDNLEGYGIDGIDVETTDGQRDDGRGD